MTSPDTSISKEDAERVKALAESLARQASEIAKQADGAGYSQDYMDSVYVKFFGNITLLSIQGKRLAP